MIQKRAEHWANLWNKKTSQQITFAPTFLLVFSARGNLVCSAQPFLSGTYVKYNNNYGTITRNEPNHERHTTFSHFTYEASGCEEMVVGMQGAGNMFTDPQIHSRKGGKYGRGDLGAEGIKKFFDSHTCSQLCTAYRTT